MANGLRTAEEILTENPWLAKLSKEEQNAHILASWMGTLLNQGYSPEKITEILDEAGAFGE